MPSFANLPLFCNDFLSSPSLTAGVSDELLSPYLTADYSQPEELSTLNSLLLSRSFLLHDRFSLVDLALFARLSATPSFLSANTYPNVIRWFNTVQHQKEVQDKKEKLLIPISIPPSAIFSIDISAATVPLKTAAAPAAAAVGKKEEKKEGKKEEKKEAKKEEQTEAKKETKKDDKKEDQKDDKKDKKEKKEKAPKAAAAPAAAAADAVAQVYRCDFRVGKIISATAHPTDARCLVETIDFGEEKPRTVVSGLADYYKVEALQNQLVVGLLNLGEANIKGVQSSGRLMVATSADGKTKELCAPPASVPAGTRISFTGVPADKFDKEIASKNQHKIFKELKTNDKKEVCYGELQFLTPDGPCTVPSVVGGTVQ